MSLIEPIIVEFTNEARKTRKVLERVPEDLFEWRPHEKSMTLGRLASHIAEIPSYIGMILDKDEFVLNREEYKPFNASSRAKILDAFDGNCAQAAESMQGRSDEHLHQVWRMKVGGMVTIEKPRIEVIRGMVLNHAIHHRGQIGVYLRINDVPLPALYGPSADERG